MRSDYGLYVVAIICFIIAGAFAASYTITDPTGIIVTMIFLLIGIISAAVGYSARPKAITPATQPTPAPVTPPLLEEMPPTSPPPAEEVTPKPPPPQEPTPSTPPIVTLPTEPEQPVKAAEEEKPKEKPVRRRRKKAQ